MHPLPTRLLLPALFLLALALRLPTLALPLEGESAVLASVAEQLGHDRGFDLAGHAPFLPVLTSVVVACGVPATAALRWVDALLGCLLAPLLYLLLRRWFGAERPGLRVAALLLATHPLLLLGAGGIEPGTGSAAGVLLLAALWALSSVHPGRRRNGALLTLLLATADPGALVFLPGLLWLYARGERAPRVQTALVLVGALLGLTAALVWMPGAAGMKAVLPGALLWPLAVLLVLLPGVPRGLGLLWSAGAPARVWVGSGALALLLGAVGLPFLPVAGAALLVSLGALGICAREDAWARRLSFSALLLSVSLSGWLLVGGPVPGAAGAAGVDSLRQLRAAVRLAAETAGVEGWIVLAVAEDAPADQSSLADLATEHWTWTRRGPAAEPTLALRRLRVFPAASFESGRTFAVVAAAAEAQGIATFDGAGIFEQELVRQIGPYVVLRARRP